MVAKASRHDQEDPSLENLILTIEVPEILRVTEVEVVVAASLLMKKVPVEEPHQAGSVTAKYVACVVVNCTALLPFIVVTSPVFSKVQAGELTVVISSLVL